MNTELKLAKLIRIDKNYQHESSLISQKENRLSFWFHGHDQDSHHVQFKCDDNKETIANRLIDLGQLMLQSCKND